jgi:DNA invertase Pin-like site-specific DNA recombinase
MTAPPAHTTLAYLRVSTLDQDIEKNKADILHFANQHDLGQVRFVEEVASGRTPWRERRIAEVLEALGADDALIAACWSAWKSWRWRRARGSASTP